MSAYLWWLINRENLRTQQALLDRTYQIQEWLNDTVSQSGLNNNYKWSLAGTQGCIVDGCFFHNVLLFKYAEDLVAFKLKFGINS